MVMCFNIQTCPTSGLDQSLSPFIHSLTAKVEQVGWTRTSVTASTTK